MAPYNGKERREGSPDTIMLLGEIQKIAVIAAQTQTSVELLRVDFSEVKKDSASCADLERINKDVERIEKEQEDHFLAHEKIKKEAIETRRWSVGAILAAAAMMLPFIASLLGWGKK